MNREQWTFENLQRIISDTSIWRVTILGLMFSLNPLGIAGLYALKDESNKLWGGGLCLAMFLISLLLTIIHYRERILFDAVKEKLKGMQVEFPAENTFWTGLNRKMVLCLYCAAIVWWFSALSFFIWRVAFCL